MNLKSKKTQLDSLRKKGKGALVFLLNYRLRIDIVLLTIGFLVAVGVVIQVFLFPADIPADISNNQLHQLDIDSIDEMELWIEERSSEHERILRIPTTVFFRSDEQVP